MNTKIYSIVVTCVMILAILAAGYFYWQAADDRNNLRRTEQSLAQTQNELQDDREQLGRLRDLVDNGLGKVKTAAALLKDSGETFLVAGDLKIAAISNSEAQAISAKILEITDKQDKIALEDTWSKFLVSQKISDYFAFSRFLANMIQGNLENIH